MSNKVIKELQKLNALCKLMDLCMRISNNTDHKLHFEAHYSTKTFDIYEIDKNGQLIWFAMTEFIILPNINKCRQKLLKYKE